MSHPYDQAVTIPKGSPLPHRSREAISPRATLLCFSHLRWDFVFQRPQHLLSRAAGTMQVIYWEEPILAGEASPRLRLRRSDEGVPRVRRLVG